MVVRGEGRGESESGSVREKDAAAREKGSEELKLTVGLIRGGGFDGRGGGLTTVKGDDGEGLRGRFVAGEGSSGARDGETG